MLLTSLLLAPAALLQGPPPPPKDGGPRLIPPFLHRAEELGLSEDQKTRLKAVLDAHRASMEAKSEAGRQAQEAVMAAVRGGTGDLTALHQTAANRHLAVLQEAQQIHSECLELLTPEQKEKAKALRPQRERSQSGERGPRPEGENRPGRPEMPGPFGAR